MKVLSVPHVSQLGKGESGIHTVIRSYFELASDYDIQFVEPEATSYDVLAIHAGTSGRYPKSGNIVAHTHGLYWTADYNIGRWAFNANQSVIGSVRHAKQITVPSRWVAETFERDMRVSPHVIPHGIDWDSWQNPDANPSGYVIGYAKNRAGVDVCNPDFLGGLALRFPNVNFKSTFAPPYSNATNIEVTGVIPYNDMKLMVQNSNVFINTTKETWGIAMLEAMASGVPVLAFNHGGATELVQHGITGYLAETDNYDDLAEGLIYCIEHAATLGANAREVAKQYSWARAMELLNGVYQLAMQPDPATVSVIIPVYNKPEQQLIRALDSVNDQTLSADEIIVVDDGSTSEVNYKTIAESRGAKFISQENSGVAVARNTGIKASNGKYILCLDSDDAIAPQFLEACVPELEANNSLGIAYTGLWAIEPDGTEGLSKWPGEFDYDRQIKGGNQIPTACVFRREAWSRVGGYHQRYAPEGCGEEDANLWLRIPSIGYGAKQVTPEGLFHYSWKSGAVSGNTEHRITDWRYWLPWTRDDDHPFASAAKPKSASHPVRQYDEPSVSVIIPVGPGHEELVANALDSLEAQTFRKWEAIVVWDLEPVIDYTERAKFMEPFTKAYPYVRQVWVNDSPKGAGYARNRGVEIARAPFILFLDADDQIHPDCIQDMLDEYGSTGFGIYTDYIGKAIVENTNELAPDLQNEILDYNDKTKVAVINHRAADFNCNRAMQQPVEGEQPYIWCNITTLIPKIWHDEIGGFDESMHSWEDLDYWWRMAWSGKCFARIKKPLLVYRFNTGSRRDAGYQDWNNLVEYMSKKKRNLTDGM